MSKRGPSQSSEQQAKPRTKKSTRDTLRLTTVPKIMSTKRNVIHINTLNKYSRLASFPREAMWQGGGSAGRCLRSQPQLSWEEGPGGGPGFPLAHCLHILPSRAPQGRRSATLPIPAQSPGRSGAGRSGAGLRGRDGCRGPPRHQSSSTPGSLQPLTPGDLAAAPGGRGL